tara:strand:- start:584 stop:1018 length:435 start_codon:yes stop_codon:yes gene_type:complete
MLDLELKNKDLKFGFANEKNLLNDVNVKYPDTIKRIEQYSHFDFRNDTLKIDFELKSRRIYKGKYNTIFFAECKLLDGRERMKKGITEKVIYVFNFEDEKTKNRDVWYWEDDGSDLEITMCGNYRRGDKAKRLANVPINKLKKF